MTRDVRARLDAFLSTPIGEVLDGPRGDPGEAVLALFHEVAGSVPAYRRFLDMHGVMCSRSGLGMVGLAARRATVGARHDP